MSQTLSETSQQDTRVWDPQCIRELEELGIFSGAVALNKESLALPGPGQVLTLVTIVMLQ